VSPTCALPGGAGREIHTFDHDALEAYEVPDEEARERAWRDVVRAEVALPTQFDGGKRGAGSVGRGGAFLGDAFLDGDQGLLAVGDRVA